MSILSGDAIAQAVADGSIRIWPFDPKQLGPASYDVRLGSGVCFYTGLLDDDREGPVMLDSRDQNMAVFGKITPEGIIIEPQRLYLMHTEEVIHSRTLVPQIDGKSSIGRLGIGVHVTAGRGDPGFDGQYTLEVFSVAHPVRLYAGMKIGQMFFHTLEGPVTDYRVRGGHYVGEAARGAQPSLSWKQFAEDVKKS